MLVFLQMGKFCHCSGIYALSNVVPPLQYYIAVLVGSPPVESPGRALPIMHASMLYLSHLYPSQAQLLSTAGSKAEAGHDFAYFLSISAGLLCLHRPCMALSPAAVLHLHASAAQANPCFNHALPFSLQRFPLVCGSEPRCCPAFACIGCSSQPLLQPRHSLQPSGLSPGICDWLSLHHSAGACRTQRRALGINE